MLNLTNTTIYLPTSNNTIISNLSSLENVCLSSQRFKNGFQYHWVYNSIAKTCTLLPNHWYSPLIIIGLGLALMAFAYTLGITIYTILKSK
jgi:hypothetical protein